MRHERRHMTSHTKRDKQQGVILILMLWVLVALSIIVFSMASEVRTETIATRNAKLMTQAYYNARAGIHETIVKLLKRNQTRFGGPIPTGIGGGGALDVEPTD